MALTVNTNLASMNALKNLNSSSRSLNAVFNRLSSGQRIATAGDDAAGLAVAENLDAASISLDAAMRNTNDGLSVVQVAEGATNQVSNILKRMRELAVQSASETLDDDERVYLQEEFLSLSSEVDRIANSTNFNGVELSNSTLTTMDVQVGIFDSGNDRIAISMGDLRSTAIGIDSGTVDLSSATKAQASLTLIDTALDSVNTTRSAYGASQNRLESALGNLETYRENLSAAKAQIMDADFAKEAADMAKYQIMQQAGTAILAQANQINAGAVQLLG